MNLRHCKPLLFIAFAVICWSVPTDLIGQNIDSTKFHRSTHIGASSWFGVSNNFINTTKPGYDREEYFQRFAFGAGMMTVFQVSPIIGISTGFRYSQHAFADSGSWNVHEYYWYSSNPDLTKVDEEILRYSMDIPVLFRVTVGNRKVRGILALGFEANLITHSKNVTYRSWRFASGNFREDEPETEILINYLPTLSFMINAGIEWAITKRSTLQFTPIFRIAFLHRHCCPEPGAPWAGGIHLAYLFELGTKAKKAD